VGTLAGGRYWNDDVMMGMILGTGTNACYVERDLPSHAPSTYVSFYLKFNEDCTISEGKDLFGRLSTWNGVDSGHHICHALMWMSSLTMRASTLARRY
jgi:hypothetical protein